MKIDGVLNKDMTKTSMFQSGRIEKIFTYSCEIKLNLYRNQKNIK
jgi:hypothetical protein